MAAWIQGTKYVRKDLSKIFVFWIYSRTNRKAGMSLPSAPLTTPLKLYNKMHLVVQQGKQKCKKMKEEIVEEKKIMTYWDTSFFFLPKYKAVLYKRDQGVTFTPRHLLSFCLGTKQYCIEGTKGPHLPPGIYFLFAWVQSSIVYKGPRAHIYPQSKTWVGSCLRVYFATSQINKNGRHCKYLTTYQPFIRSNKFSNLHLNYYVLLLMSLDHTIAYLLSEVYVNERD